MSVKRYEAANAYIVVEGDSAPYFSVKDKEGDRVIYNSFVSSAIGIDQAFEKAKIIADKHRVVQPEKVTQPIASVLKDMETKLVDEVAKLAAAKAGDKNVSD